eukprot:347992-Hanusia_phi.AAC.2
MTARRRSLECFQTALLPASPSHGSRGYTHASPPLADAVRIPFCAHGIIAETTNFDTLTSNFHLFTCSTIGDEQTSALVCKHFEKLHCRMSDNNTRSEKTAFVLKHLPPLWKR